MKATLTKCERFGADHKMIDHGFSKYAMPRLGTDEQGSPVVVLQVWDYDNPIREEQIHLTHHEVESVSLSKGHGSYSEEGVTAHYAEWTYTLTLTEEAGYVVLKGVGDEMVFISWTALYGDGQRSFQDQEGNAVMWSAGGFHEELPSVEDEARALARRLNPLTDLDLISSLRGLWERKQGLRHQACDILRKGTAKLLFDGKPPEV
jgi:hypothetical protein